MQKFMIVSCLAVAAIADPFHGVAVTLEDRDNLHGHELASGYAISQPHPGHAASYQQLTKLHSGHFFKRSAEPFYGTAVTVEDNDNIHGDELSSGYAISQPHPGLAGSFQQVSRLHHGHGKRSADASYGYGAVATLENLNNVHGHELESQYAISQPHPGHAGSFQQVSKLHTGHGYGHAFGYGKRDADASYGYGAVATLENLNNVHGHELESQYAISQPHPGHAGSFQQVSKLHTGHGYGHAFGYGKRDADASYGHGHSGYPHGHGHSQYAISQNHPGHSGSFQQVSLLHTGYPGY